MATWVIGNEGDRDKRKAARAISSAAASAYVVSGKILTDAATGCWCCLLSLLSLPSFTA
jgi:hypothetical protein